MAKKRKRKPLGDNEVRINRINVVAKAVTMMFVALVKWSGFVVIAFFIYKSIDSLSGETTVADIVIQMLGEIRISEYVAYILGTGGVTYGALQRRLRKSKVDELAKRIKSFETGIDPGRTSSNLPPTGDT